MNSKKNFYILGTLCLSIFIFAQAKPRSDKMTRKQRRSIRSAKHKSKTSAPSGGVLNGSLSTLISEVQTVRSDKVKNLILQAEEAAQILDAKVSKTLQNLEKSAQQQIAEMKQEVSAKTLNIKKQAAEQAYLIKVQAEKQAQEAEQEAKLESEQLEQKLKLQKNNLETTVLEKTKEIKRQAAETVLDLIAKAEQQALEAKKKAREEALLKKIESQPIVSFNASQGLLSSSAKSLPIPVDSEWKKDVARQFYHDMSLMRRIIIDGESKDEAADFAARFDQQQNWFDTTLRNTAHIDDANYKKIIERKNKLHTITDAQRKADLILNETLNLSELTFEQQKKLRLLVLYELNALVNNQPKNIQQSGYLPIDRADINGLISRLFKEVKSSKDALPSEAKETKSRDSEVEVQEALPETLSPLMTISLKPELSPVISSQDKIDSKSEQALPPLTVQDDLKLPSISDIAQQIGSHELDKLAAEINDLRKMLAQEERDRTRLELDSKRMLENKGNKIIELEILLSQAQSNIKKFSEKISKSKQKLAQSRASTKSIEDLRETDKQERDQLIRDLDAKEAKIKDLQQSLDKAQEDLLLAKKSAEQEKNEAVNVAEQKLKNSFKSKLEAKEVENLELETLNIQYKKEISHLQEKIKSCETEKTAALLRVDEIQKQLAQAGLQKEESSSLLQATLKNRLEDSGKQNIEHEVTIKSLEKQISHLDGSIKKMEQEKMAALQQAQEAQRQALLAEQEKVKALAKAAEESKNARQMLKNGQTKLNQANIIETIADKTLQDGNALLRRKNEELQTRYKGLDQETQLLNEKRRTFDATVEKTKTQIDQAMRSASEAELQVLTVKQKAKIEIEQARRNALKDELEQHVLLDEKNRILEKREQKIENQKSVLAKEKIGILSQEVELGQKKDRLSKKITSQLKEGLEKELLVRVAS